MQLPRGTLEKSHRGPGTLASVTESIARDNLTGYLRVSILSEHASECVVVYLGGKPVMAFVSGAKDDRPDPGLSAITASIQQSDCIIEVCRLGDKQVAVLQELYGQFAYKEPLPPARPAEKPSPSKAMPSPVKSPAPQAGREKAAATQPSRFIKPEIRGRFVRSEELGDISDYPERYPGDTGHLLFLARQDGIPEENHAIIVAGRIEAVYNDQGIVPNVPDWLRGVPGLAEFYSVEPAVLTSVLLRSLKGVPGVVSAETPAAVRQPAAQPVKPPETGHVAPAPRPTPAPAPEPVIRPRSVGVSATAILEKSRSAEPAHVEDDITRTVDELSRSMDDDIAMVRKVEQDFALHADELLEKLDLGHLRKERRKQ